MLKTDKREGSDHSCVIDGTKSDFLHDAAYAHALVLAMKDWDSPHMTMGDTLISRVRAKAEFLMREWGYVEVEDGGG